MVKIPNTYGLRLDLPGENHDPYNWGGEASFGETNVIRNYIDACRDAQEFAPPARPGGAESAVPTKEDWQAQIDAAAPYVATFNDVDSQGRPAAIPAEFYELDQTIGPERPDLHRMLRMDTTSVGDRAGITGVDHNWSYTVYAPEEGAHLAITKIELANRDGIPVDLHPADQWYEVKSVTSIETKSESTRDWDQVRDLATKTALGYDGRFHGGYYAAYPPQATVTVNRAGAITVNEVAPGPIPARAVREQIDGEIEAVELAGDLTMWTQKSTKDQDFIKNLTTTETAHRFGYDHRSHTGTAVFTGTDSTGTAIGLNRAQTRALVNIIEESNPNTFRGRDVGSDIAAFDTRFKHGLDTVLIEQGKARGAQAQRLAQESLNIPGTATPGVSGPGLS
ncbi:hypothetical protein [Nesterenkonia alkaliphila]|uniref:Uncharacterized protein n=1 Tax=Nesterenkonia alkaliphila TaxID=1463631 RepID=A0A7K1UH42_9MICC|nr:hypothetical protein [Nesterenkonia alkaliphila]MVT25732.1 hypothetical protein [Nesterenkonia alkaliphila]GFZ85407.1 hypothetical protein GCM10011359_13190 [Nesterenkonia alkaliphila]